MARGGGARRLVASDAQLFASHDGGDSWARVPFDLPERTSTHGLGAAHGELLVLVAGGGPDRYLAFRSRDGGATFSAPITAPQSFLPQRVQAIAEGFVLRSWHDWKTPARLWLLPFAGGGQ